MIASVSGVVPSPPGPVGGSFPGTDGRRHLYWQIRRELWENRVVYLGPLLVTLFVLVGSLISIAGLPEKVRALPEAGPSPQHSQMLKPFGLAPAPIMLATILIGMFYCLDALYGERRDRSILFWKSMPVSDLATVLSKASIPLVVLPLIAFSLSVTIFFSLLLSGSVILAGSGLSPSPLWAEVRFVQEPIVMAYGLTVHAMWHAPIYGWLLLVSAWARRAPFAWVVLPPLILSTFERLAFNTTSVPDFLRNRVTGAMQAAFDLSTPAGHAGMFDELSQLTPGRFLTTPGLWGGLAFAAACLAVAVHLRRHREPS